MKAEDPNPRRAAQYVRMSTEAQDYSIEGQVEAIGQYAALHGWEVIRTYADHGISGLGIEKRSGLRNLLADVFSGTKEFQAVLVYDVSRWGRFQNPDQGAHYEFMCGEAGVEIIYCAEPFANDGSPASALIKHIKRAMAAEYSRELSVKIRGVKANLGAQGFWQGSPPGYVYRREVVSLDGVRLAIRERGEWQGFPKARTRLALGPTQEVETVKRIFRLYLSKDGTYVEVANRLNGEGIPALEGRPWTMQAVKCILRNPKYAGRPMIGKSRSVLGGSVIRMHPRDWKEVSGGCPAIVTSKQFVAAQRKIEERTTLASKTAALAELRHLLAEHGHLSDWIIRKHGRWSPTVYLRRFGTLANAFREVGYTPPYRQFSLRQRLVSPPDQVDADLTSFRHRMLEALREVLASHGRLTRRLIDADERVPSSTTFVKWFGSLDAVYSEVGYRAYGRQRKNMKPGLATDGTRQCPFEAKGSTDG